MAFARKDYQHLIFLGEGGEARVFRAAQTSVNRVVAIREIKSASAKRAEQEAAVLSSLRHQGLAGLIDFGYEHGHFYMVQDYVRGASPLDLGALPALAAIRCARLLAKTLQFLHSKGLVHGDLHPGNLLLTSANECVLVDFGMVRRLGETPQEALGSPRYFAPEHFLGQPFTPASDLFSFGSLFFFLLTGCELFPQSRYEEIASAVLALESADARKALALRWLDLPTEILPILDGCLQFAAADRFEDMDELEENLEIAENKVRARMSIQEAAGQLAHLDATILNKVVLRETRALEQAYAGAQKKGTWQEIQWILHDLLALNPQDPSVHARLRNIAAKKRRRKLVLRIWTAAAMLLVMALSILALVHNRHTTTLDEMGQDLANESRTVDSPEDIARSRLRPLRLVTVPDAERFEVIMVDSVSQPLENGVLRVHVGHHRFRGKIIGQKEWKSAILVVPDSGPVQFKWLGK